MTEEIIVPPVVSKPIKKDCFHKTEYIHKGGRPKNVEPISMSLKDFTSSMRYGQVLKPAQQKKLSLQQEIYYLGILKLREKDVPVSWVNLWTQMVKMIDQKEGIQVVQEAEKTTITTNQDSTIIDRIKESRKHKDEENNDN